MEEYRYFSLNYAVLEICYVAVGLVIIAEAYLSRSEPMAVVMFGAMAVLAAFRFCEVRWKKEKMWRMALLYSEVYETIMKEKVKE
jgi:hypothetical protein